MREAALRIPFRLLIADGRQQPPILAALFGRLFEPFPVQRQAALQMPHEAVGAREFQFLGPAVIAVDDRRQARRCGAGARNNRQCRAEIADRARSPPTRSIGCPGNRRRCAVPDAHRAPGRIRWNPQSCNRSCRQPPPSNSACESVLAFSTHTNRGRNRGLHSASSRASYRPRFPDRHCRSQRANPAASRPGGKSSARARADRRGQIQRRRSACAGTFNPAAAKCARPVFERGIDFRIAVAPA